MRAPRSLNATPTERSLGLRKNYPAPARMPGLAVERTCARRCQIKATIRRHARFRVENGIALTMVFTDSVEKFDP